MKKSLKIAKLNVKDTLKAIVIFYLIIVSVLISLCIFTNNSSKGSTTALELSTIIFLFVCGLNSFKDNFYFAQSVNISRKSFFMGIIISIFPITLLMAIVDIIINRIMNLFIKSASIYDVLYGSPRILNSSDLYNGWVQSNSIKTIISTLLVLFAMYIVAYSLGLVINMIYYRSNTFMKILISIVPPALFITGGIAGSQSGNIYLELIKRVFGISDGNVILAIFSYSVLFIIFVAVGKLLINEAAIKER